MWATKSGIANLGCSWIHLQQDSKINFWRSVMRLRKSIIRSNVLDVSEIKRISHSSTESEVSSPDAGLRMEGRPELQFWDCVLGTFSPNYSVGGNSVRQRCQRHSHFDNEMSFDMADDLPPEVHNSSCVHLGCTFMRAAKQLFV